MGLNGSRGVLESCKQVSWILLFSFLTSIQEARIAWWCDSWIKCWGDYGTNKPQEHSQMLYITTNCLSVLILEKNRKGGQETFLNKWGFDDTGILPSCLLRTLYWLFRCRILKWTKHLPVSCFPFLLSSLLEPSGWEDFKVVLTLTPSEWHKWLCKAYWWSKSKQWNFVSGLQAIHSRSSDN